MKRHTLSDQLGKVADSSANSEKITTRQVRKMKVNEELSQSAENSLRNKVRNRVVAALTSLEVAKTDKRAYVVMEGDWGGQIYLTVPARMVKCDEDTLKKLLRVIDRIEWGCNEGNGAMMYFERMNRRYPGVGGGMGGGAMLENDIWVHANLESLECKIKDVLLGWKPVEDIMDSIKLTEEELASYRDYITGLEKTE